LRDVQQRIQSKQRSIIVVVAITILASVVLGEGIVLYAAAHLNTVYTHANLRPKDVPYYAENICGTGTDCDAKWTLRWSSINYWVQWTDVLHVLMITAMPFLIIVTILLRVDLVSLYWVVWGILFILLLLKVIGWNLYTFIFCETSPLCMDESGIAVDNGASNTFYMRILADVLAFVAYVLLAVAGTMFADAQEPLIANNLSKRD